MTILDHSVLRRLTTRADASPSALTSIAESSRIGLFISAINALIFYAGAWGAADPLVLTAWLAAVMAAPLFVFLRSSKALKRRAPKQISQKAFRRAVAFSAVFALPWAVLPLFFLGASGGVVELMTFTATAGMAAGGAFMLHRLPPAAFAFYGTILAANTLGCVIHGIGDYWAMALFAFPYGAYLTVIALSANQTALEREKSLESANQALADLQSANRELDQLRAAAERDAVVDELTGLGNRRGVARETQRREAERRSGVAALHIDLDHFKQINDTLGHAAGDFVLREVARILKRATRPGDYLARIGGDEFVVFCDCDGDPRALHALASRLIAEIRKPLDYKGEICVVGASIGIDHTRRGREREPLDLDRMLRNADIALYRAKALGRNRHQFFDDALRAEFQTQKSLGDDLALALRQGQIETVYQPQCLADGRTLCGVEALARWRHPTRGELAPGVFLPIAERLGLIAELDQRVLEQALRDFAFWQAEGLEIPRLAVNVSHSRLRDPDLPARLTALEIPQGRLSFEIRESLIADHGDDALKLALDALDEAGVAFEIDGFGAGSCSLVSLLQLRPTRLKIAGALSSSVVRSPRHRKLMRSLVEIARSLEITVLAEGVETAEQATAAAAVGCDQLQGFFFARPMSAEALARRFAAKTPAALPSATQADSR